MRAGGSTLQPQGKRQPLLERSWRAYTRGEVVLGPKLSHVPYAPQATCDISAQGGHSPMNRDAQLRTDFPLRT